MGEEKQRSVEKKKVRRLDQDPGERENLTKKKKTKTIHNNLRREEAARGDNPGWKSITGTQERDQWRSPFLH